MLIVSQGSFQGCFSPDLTVRMMIRPLPPVGVGLDSSRPVWRSTALRVESAGGRLGCFFSGLRVFEETLR